MGRIGVPELIFIGLVIILLFGAKKLPEIGRSLGKAIQEFKKAGKDIKDDILLLLATLILGFAVYNSVTDKVEMHQHEEFFQEVQDFIARGGRNTNVMGYKMCVRVNELEKKHQGTTLTNCAIIYTPK